MRRSIIIEVAIIILFLISIPIALLVERSAAVSDEVKGSASAYQQKGDQLYNQGKLSDASAQYWQALKLDPKLEDALFRLADIYYENLWNYEALNELKKLEKINRNYKGLYLLEGKIYNGRIGDADSAFEALQKVIASDPQNAEAYYFLGTIYQQKNKKEEAISSYEKSLATDSDDKESIAKSYLQLGRIYKIEGNLDKAIDMLESSLSIKPDSKEIISDLTGAYSQKADSYKSEQKFDEAAKIYEWIVRLDPDNIENVEYYMELGSIYRSYELYNKAMEAYKAITKLDPLNFDAFSALKELEMMKSGVIEN